MENNSTNKTIGLSFSSMCFILTIVFIILKLCNVIAWSWLYVCMPLIVMAGIYVLLIIISLVMTIVLAIMNKNN